MPNLFAIRADDPMVFNAGFNIYSSARESRIAWGHNDGMEVKIPSPPKKAERNVPAPALECVCLARSLSLLSSTATAFVILLHTF